MGFGKRAVPPGKPTALVSSPAIAGTNAGGFDSAPLVDTASPASTPQQRTEDLRQAMLRLLMQAGDIATAIRENGIIAVRGVDDEIDPAGPPLVLRGFREFFTHVASGKTMNSVYAYSDAPALGVLDPNAQFHLQVLTGRIFELNRYCQQAVKDDALGVALQSPSLPPLVDRIIAGTAYFAGFFDGVAISRPYFGAVPVRSIPSSVMARLTDSYERHKLMASDRMLQPQALLDMLPSRRWPQVGIETLWASHPGERHINGVYFPAEHAKPILAGQVSSSGAVAVVG